MLRSRALSAVTGVAVLLAVAGCAPVAAAPVNDIERREIRQQVLDSAWDRVSARFPIAVRPVVSIQRTVDNVELPGLLAACLDEAGFTVIEDSVLLLGGQTELEFALAQYSCTARYPTLSRVTASLSDDQIGALWDYYTQRVRPCLASLGVATTDPPERSFFVDRYGFDTWNPFDLPRESGLDARRLSAAEEQCPPVPEWLDLATDPAT